MADEQALVIYTALGWTDLFTAIAGIQNLPLLGIGTTADATNPFSAQAQQGAADGDDVGFVLQTAFVTKALVGLFGSDISASPCRPTAAPSTMRCGLIPTPAS